jgi:hypothetical protein
MNKIRKWNKALAPVIVNKESCWLYDGTDYTIRYHLFYKAKIIYNTYTPSKLYPGIKSYTIIEL